MFPSSLLRLHAKLQDPDSLLCQQFVDTSLAQEIMYTAQQIAEEATDYCNEAGAVRGLSR